MSRTVQEIDANIEAGVLRAAHEDVRPFAAMRLPLGGAKPMSREADLRLICKLVDLYWDRTRCTGCGRCLDFCPRGVFSQREDGGIRITASLCIPCGGCLGACPSGAIGLIAGG